MSTGTSLREKAASLLDQANRAEAKAAEEAAAIRARNAERRATHNATLRATELPAAREAVAAAREAFAVAVADRGDVLAAYLDYALAHSAYVHTHNTVSRASFWMVDNDVAGPVGVSGTGVIHYADGLDPIYDADPQPLAVMHARAVQAAAAVHRAAYARELSAPLSAALELEADE